MRIAARGRARFRVDWSAVAAFRASCVGGAWLCRERDAGRASPFAVAPLRAVRAVVDERLGRADVAILAWVATAQRAFGGAAFIATHDTLAELLGCGERTARRAVYRLLECGLLARVPLYRPRAADRPDGDRARCEVAYALSDLAAGFVATPAPRREPRPNNTPGHFGQASPEELNLRDSETQTRTCVRDEVSPPATVDGSSAVPSPRPRRKAERERVKTDERPATASNPSPLTQLPDPELGRERVATSAPPATSMSARAAQRDAERAARRATAADNRRDPLGLTDAWAAFERKERGE